MIANGLEYACSDILPSFNFECDATNMLKLRPSILPLVFGQLLDEKGLCTYELQVCDTEIYQPRNLEEDIAQILSSKPEAAKSNDFVNNLYRNLKPSKSPIKVALLSDFHVDPEYTEGANTNCS